MADRIGTAAIVTSRGVNLPRAGMSENQFQAAVVKLARLLGWAQYHTFLSKRSQPGFPDLILIRGSRIIAAELKTDTGVASPEQERWLELFRGAGVLAVLWRPRDWDWIERELQRAV